MTQQFEQQVVFLGTQRNFEAGLADAARNKIDLDVAEVQRLSRSRS